MKKFFFFLGLINTSLFGQSYFQNIRTDENAKYLMLKSNYEDSSFMPLKIGNKYQYIMSTYGNHVVNYFLIYGDVVKDTQVSNKNYFLFKLGNRDYWFRYSEIENKLYKWHNNEDLLYMDFNKTPGDTFMCLTVPATILGGDTILFSKNYIYRGYDLIWSVNEIELFAKGLGLFNSRYETIWPLLYSSQNISLIMAILYDSSGNSHNFTNHSKPKITVNPITLISTGNFKLDFTVWHPYNRIVPPGNQSLIFIEFARFESHYSKKDSVIMRSAINFFNYSTTYSVSINLDTTLMQNGFVFKYRILAKDKGIIPETSYSPDSGFYQCSWDFSTNVGQELQSISNPELYQNYPNPFNPTTRIQYQVSSNAYVTLKVYDVLGNEVATLVEESKPAGRYEVEFNPASSIGVNSIKYLATNVYFYQLRAGNFVQTKKMILLR